MPESEEKSIIDALAGISGPGAVVLFERLVVAIEAIATAVQKIAGT